MYKPYDQHFNNTDLCNNNSKSLTWNFYQNLSNPSCQKVAIAIHALIVDKVFSSVRAWCNKKVHGNRPIAAQPTSS